MSRPADDDSATEVTSTTRTTTTYWVDGNRHGTPWSAPKVLGLVGLPLMALTTAVATPWAVDHIEDQLTENARNDLAAAGIDPDDFSIDFSYRDGRARGVIPAGFSAQTLGATVNDDLQRDFSIVPKTPRAAAAAASTGQVRDSEQADAASPTVATPEVATPEVATTTSPTTTLPSTTAPSTLPSTTAPSTTVLVSTSTTEPTPTSSGDSGGTGQTIGAPTSFDGAASDPDLDPGSASPNQAAALQDELDQLGPQISSAVVFDNASARLSPSAMATLDQVADVLAANSVPTVEITGHTDNLGAGDQNQTLSQLRADSVRAYLIEQGIDPDRLIATGIGDAEPVDTNDTEAGRRRNRRVAFEALIGT